MPIAATDVHYFDDAARAACVMFETWNDASPAREWVAITGAAEPYRSGEFFRRELPCILEVLRQAPTLPDAIVVDGFVWLDQGRSPGLGARVWEALDRKCAVVGVAKNPRHGSPDARAVLRGGSAKPLWVSAAGMVLDDAALLVQGMHGAFRIHDLLRRVDHLARGLELPRDPNAAP